MTLSSEGLYKSLFHSIDDGLCVVELISNDAENPADFVFREYNTAFASQFGDELAGKTLRDVLPHIESRWSVLLAQVAQTGVSLRFDEQHSGRWYSIRISLVGEMGSKLLAVVLNDISVGKNHEHQQADAARALRDNEEKYRGFFTSMDEAYYTVEVLYDQDNRPTDYRFLEVNAVFGQIMGLGQDVVGKTIREVAPQGNLTWIETFGQIALTGRPGRYTGALTEHRDRWYEGYVFRVEGDGSRKLAVIVRDITERRQAEERQAFLLNLSDALRPLSDPLKIQATSADLLGEHLKANRAHYSETVGEHIYIHHCYVNGLSPMTGKFRLRDFGERLVAGYRSGKVQMCRDTNTDSSISPTERELLKAAHMGAYLAVPLVKNGEWLATLAIHTIRPRQWKAIEISLVEEVAQRTWAAVERAKAEEALQKSEDKYRSLFNSMDEGFCTIKIIENEAGQAVDYLFTEVNRVYERHTGQSNPVGKLGSEISQTTEPYWLDIYSKVARTGQPIRFENYHGGSQRWYESYASRIGGSTSRQVAIIFNDVTERKKAEKALKENDRRKDEFLAMLAHELRNPMSTIRNGLQILASTAGGNDAANATLAMMNRQTDHLVRMVDDLLDVSRISRGKIELRKEQVDLVELVRQAIDTVQSMYHHLGRQLHYTLPSEPLLLSGDATRLTQVVINLLTNGARYTMDGGEVWLNLERREDSTGPEAVLRVRDNGIGLSEDQFSAIFELFVQVDNSHARAQGGLGLGLTLVKQLVEMHGGRVEASSGGLGLGSTFTIHLPVFPTVSKPITTPTAHVSRSAVNRRILVIDDNPDATETLSMLLRIKGFEAHTRNSGVAGFEAAESLRPSVILLDIGMPVMDGYQTCKLIREQSWGNGMAVIALTGYGHEEDMQRTKEAGFDAHLVKPVDMEGLISLLYDYLGNSPTANARP